MSHLVADLEGFEAIEFNASDVRSKKALDDLVKDALDTRSIGEFFKADRGAAATMSKKKKAVIIMDEVDGMSAGDRGGSAELIRMIKKSKVPIICICNDRRSPKMRSLANSCLDLSLRRPTAQQVEARIRNIAAKEGLELKANVVAELVASTSADIRQILNLLSTYRLSSSSLSYDQSKALAKTAQKNITVGPFDAMQKLFSQGTYRSSTFPEKIENYFHDYSLIPLMVQENYIRMTPALAKEVAKTPKSIETETMTLISNAADMISRADLLDKLQRRYCLMMLLLNWSTD
jgi:replication factor C subunit 1